MNSPNDALNRIRQQLRVIQTYVENGSKGANERYYPPDSYHFKSLIDELFHLLDPLEESGMFSLSELKNLQDCRSDFYPNDITKLSILEEKKKKAKSEVAKTMAQNELMQYINETASRICNTIEKNLLK